MGLQCSRGVSDGERRHRGEDKPCVRSPVSPQAIAQHLLAADSGPLTHTSCSSEVQLKVHLLPGLLQLPGACLSVFPTHGSAPKPWSPGCIVGRAISGAGLAGSDGSSIPVQERAWPWAVCPAAPKGQGCRRGDSHFWEWQVAHIQQRTQPPSPEP